ncbi:MAG: SGNH/GDSL hydrolase family protein [Acidimicrobiia bacterium]|nr:SGNH/GDSL hydrolase family protein [Acidimicrobiia bacterium]
MIDPPPPYRPGALARLGARVSPGIGQVLDTVQSRSNEWHEASVAALDGSSPLWVALGDSTAQGIGASAYDRGYVGQLGQVLTERGRRHDIVNLALTGARVDDVLERQLATLHRLPRSASLITCAIGSNDVLRVDTATVVNRRMRTLLARLRAVADDGGGTVIVATVPQGRNSLFARRLNELIRRDAPRHGLCVADVARTITGPFDQKVAADRFHPNDRGYADWTTAFVQALDQAQE